MAAETPAPSSSPVSSPRPWVVVLWSLLLALLCVWVVQQGGRSRPELWFLDLLFKVRHAVHGSQPVSDRLSLILIDEESFTAIGKPSALWQPELAGVLQALTEAGAAGVGVDWILNPPRDRLGETRGSREMKALIDQGEELLGLTILSRPVVLIEHLGRQANPFSIQQAAQAQERKNLADASLITDPDGIVRRIPLHYEKSMLTATFAGRLAELATGETFCLGRDGVPRLGRLEIPAEREGTVLLVNFPGPPGVIPRIPLSVLLRRIEQGDPLAEFRGRVCLIGPGDPSFGDLAIVPASSPKYTYGVEVHAAALNTLLTGRFVRRAQPAVDVLPALGLALLAGLLAAYCPLPAALCATAGLLLVYFGLSLELFTWTGLWLSLPGPAVAAVLSFGAGTAERYLMVERGRSSLRRLFGRYVSVPVMEELLRNPASLELGGTHRRVTVLFSDINDFTPACEGRPPEEVLLMLNRYFGEMIALIDRHGGTLKQFVGDEIMVIFGAPQAAADHAARAVRTGLDMLERLGAMRAESDGLPGFYDVKIGIHTGDVVAGNVGSERRTEYAVVGDDVNLTARIESETKKLGVNLLASEDTWREAAPALPEVEWTCHGPRTFKGKSEPKVVYEARWKR